MEGQKAYNGRPLNTRVHSSLPSPFTVRLTLQTDDGKEAQLTFQHTNPALELETEESARKRAADGETIHYYTYCDDVDALDRSFVTLGCNAEYYILRFGSNSQYIYPVDLKRAAYNAKTTGIPEQELASDASTKVYALVDPDVPTAYALKFSLTTATGNVTDYVLLPPLSTP